MVTVCCTKELHKWNRFLIVAKHPQKPWCWHTSCWKSVPFLSVPLSPPLCFRLVLQALLTLDVWRANSYPSMSHTKCVNNDLVHCRFHMKDTHCWLLTSRFQIEWGERVCTTDSGTVLPDINIIFWLIATRLLPNHNRKGKQPQKDRESWLYSTILLSPREHNIPTTEKK